MMEALIKETLSNSILELEGEKQKCEPFFPFTVNELKLIDCGSTSLYHGKL